jgi:hypothetical protein
VTTPAVSPAFVGLETHGCQRLGCTESETRPLFAFSIGDTGPGGGIIFYVADGLGGRDLGFTLYMNATDTVGTSAHYLEAAPANISDYLQWASANHLIPGLSNWDVIAEREIDWGIGRGRKNTEIIIAHSAANSYDTPAAARTRTGMHGDGTMNDWFLPSRNELNQLFINRVIVNSASIAIGGSSLGTSVFWSSSQIDTFFVPVQVFSDGSRPSNHKDSVDTVRAIRAF